MTTLGRGIFARAQRLAILAALAAALCTGSLAQSEASDWEARAGGTMGFDVASVKQHPYDPASPYYIPKSNFPLDDSDSFKPTGGLMSSENRPVLSYIIFAYKLNLDQNLHLKHPNWTTSEHFDIEARGPANATKDQMRLMLQSLLKERFKLVVHWENEQAQVFKVVLVRDGKLGPQLAPYKEGTCRDDTSGAQQISANTSLPGCSAGMKYLPDGQYQVEGRKQPMEKIAGTLQHWPGTGIDKPIMDGTGLTGFYDYVLTWAPELRPNAQAQPQASGPSYLEALRDQLGLKLVSGTAPMRYLVIDHIEEPTPN